MRIDAHTGILPLGAFQACGGRMRLHGGGGGDGGGSSSASNTSTTTQNYDKRVAVDTGVGLSSDSSTVTVNALDANAIIEAFDFATKAGANAALIANNSTVGALETVDRNAALTGKAFTDSLDFARTVFSQGLNVLTIAGDQVKAQGNLIASAWDNSKGSGAEKQTLFYVAVGAVALVAVATVWGKK